MTERLMVDEEVMAMQAAEIESLRAEIRRLEWRSGDPKRVEQLQIIADQNAHAAAHAFHQLSEARAEALAILAVSERHDTPGWNAVSDCARRILKVTS